MSQIKSHLERILYITDQLLSYYQKVSQKIYSRVYTLSQARINKEFSRFQNITFQFLCLLTYDIWLTGTKCNRNFNTFEKIFLLNIYRNPLLSQGRNFLCNSFCNLDLRMSIHSQLKVLVRVKVTTKSYQASSSNLPSLSLSDPQC